MVPDKPANEKTDSIQDIALKLLDEQLRVLEIDNEPRERTVFVLGSKAVGKSTAINKFFDKEELVRPTLALEYFYGKRTSSSQGTQKQVLHVWELGSLENSDQLIPVPFRSNGAKNMAVVLFVDLSQPKSLWVDLENAYTGLKNAYTNLLNETDLAVHLEKASERVGKEHADLSTMILFPFPLVIVGGKYDIFMDFDPELKKHICRCLRSMAHIMGASLLFYSSQMPKLAKTLRDTISHLGFGSPAQQPFRIFNVDYNAPISVWFGSDSWDQIGSNSLSIEQIGLVFCQEVPQVKNSNSSSINDPAKDPGFRETIIDDMREQKNQELAMLIKETEMRGKFETIDD